MNLKEKATSSIKWNTVATISITLIGILQLSILTRLLEKSDFGLIAIANLVISFTGLFSEMGVTVALIHKQGISQKEYSSMYWLNVFTNCVMCLLTILLSPLIAIFYSEPILVKIITILSLSFLFNAFGKIFYTIKIKKLDFDFISKVRILAYFLGFILTILLAHCKFGVMCLAYGHLFTIGFNQLVFAIAGLKSQHILFHFSFSEIKGFLNIGIYQLFTQILDFLASRLDVFLIGRFFTMDDLGVYNIAKELVLKPYSLVNSISSNVFSSAFARIQDNLELLNAHFSKLLKTITLITSPIYMLLFVFADLIVSILYGSSFAEVAIFIRILTLVGVFSAISSQGGSVMISLGRTDLGLKWTIVRIIMSTTAIISFSIIGLYAVAIGQAFLEVISIYIYFIIVLRPMLNISFFNYLKAFVDVIIVLSAIAILFTSAEMFFPINLIIQLLYLLSISVIYFVYVHKYHPFFEDIVVGFIPNKIRLLFSSKR